MSDWVALLLVFWALWAVDGFRLLPAGSFTWVGGFRRRGVRHTFGRWSWPGILPTSWRAITADVPLTFSPRGISNRPAGSAARPAEQPARVVAFAWEEISEVGLARGWIYINGARFCRDTGHVSPREILAWTRLERGERERRMRTRLRAWFRPAQLQRRAVVLRARTATAVMFNAIGLAVLVAISVYVICDVAASLPARYSRAVARALPWLVGYAGALHLGAVAFAVRAVRRLKAVRTERRGSALFSAFLLPPQAFRLRAHAGDGFFPVQHPLAAAFAWGSAEVRSEMAFRVLGDLRWPIGGQDESPLGREVADWFRTELEAVIAPLTVAQGIAIEALFAAPRPQVGSCSYCPRCGDQFASGAGRCPRGVPLRPMRAGH